jgi:hypothetical protein
MRRRAPARSIPSGETRAPSRAGLSRGLAAGARPRQEKQSAFPDTVAAGRDTVNNRDRISAILHYRAADRLPVVHFGFWDETLAKWASEGHITPEEARGWADGNETDRSVAARLGFDCNWQTMFFSDANIRPMFEPKVIEELPDGMRKVLNPEGMIVLEKPGVRSIPSEVDHLLHDRAAWEEHYLPRMRYNDDRVDVAALRRMKASPGRTEPLGLHCGSLYGSLRGWMGVMGISYLQADDEALYTEIIDTMGSLALKVMEKVLSEFDDFDYAHFWEDICFKNGPLVIPSVFREKVGPHYARITKLVRSHGIDICSLDCDGVIDTLVPIWFENGVNTMFPIEVGTWGASIEPWRKAYGRDLRGVGGMDKKAFAHGRKAVDAEIERLRPLVDLGGFIPCPDHRIAPDAEWDNVRYYCDRMRAVFG